MQAWAMVTSLLALSIAGNAWAQPVPANLPGKFNTHTERDDNQSCTGAAQSCFDWCKKNSPVSKACPEECTWRISYCKETGLYPQETRRSVWVGKRR